MLYEGQDRDERAHDRIVTRTANRISRELDAMCADLPDMVAPQRAFENVMKALAVAQPWLMRLLMEDHDIREAYYNAIADIPAAPPTPSIGE